MADRGNPNSISDVGVGVLCARAAIIGAHLNVKINATSIKDETFKIKILSKAESIRLDAVQQEKELLAFIESKLL